MTTSTLTDKGQTTVPLKIRQALKVRARQKLSWTIQNDGSATVRPEPSLLSLFGSLKSTAKFPGIKAEREAAEQEVARQFANRRAK